MTTVAVSPSGSMPFDTAATTKKAIAAIEEAASHGAELLVFPEEYLGTYPKGLTFGSPIGRRTDAGRAASLRCAEAAVALDGPEIAET